MRIHPAWVALGIVLFGCSGPPAGESDGGGVLPPGTDARVPDRDAGSAPASVAERARALATYLRGEPRFMVGMGNDLDNDADRSGVFTLGVDLDVHYMYLVGYSDRGGWTEWNGDGQFASIRADAAERNGGLTPMFSYYQLALEYEQGNDALRDADRMRVWLNDVRVLFQRLGELGRPALIHWEPDFFAYLQNRLREMGTTPAAYSAQIRHVPECQGMEENAASLVPCLDAMRDALAPMVRMGMHASQWASWYDERDASADVEGAARDVAAFLSAMGAAHTDFVVVETLDRDAGFWETSGGMAGVCSVTDGSRGAVYWDETNATLPNFHRHFQWVRALTDALGLPAMWWQTPFGVPSDTCGGSEGHWRDNRVRYFFSHVDELVAAGGVGMVFGTGAGGQTFINTDGDQFRNAVTAYVASPVMLP